MVNSKRQSRGAYAVPVNKPTQHFGKSGAQRD
jgi:hypothetical protein